MRVPVSVTNGETTPPVEEDSSSEEDTSVDSSSSEKPVRVIYIDPAILWIVGGILVLGLGACVGFVVIKRKKTENGVKTQDVMDVEEVGAVAEKDVNEALEGVEKVDGETVDKQQSNDDGASE